MAHVQHLYLGLGYRTGFSEGLWGFQGFKWLIGVQWGDEVTRLIMVSGFTEVHRCPVYSVHCTMYIVQLSLYTVQPTLNPINPLKPHPMPKPQVEELHMCTVYTINRLPIHVNIDYITRYA